MDFAQYAARDAKKKSEEEENEEVRVREVEDFIPPHSDEDLSDFLDELGHDMWGDYGGDLYAHNGGDGKLDFEDTFFEAMEKEEIARSDRGPLRPLEFRFDVEDSNILTKETIRIKREKKKPAVKTKNLKRKRERARKPVPVPVMKLIEKKKKKRRRRRKNEHVPFGENKRRDIAMARERSQGRFVESEWEFVPLSQLM